MKYSIQEIEKACSDLGVSRNITTGIVDNLPQKRSPQENKALHVLFENISFELNRMGRTFTFKGLKGIDIECKYTATIVKELIWKPLQNALLEKESTTELTNSDIKLIFEILERWFAEQGIEILFPSIESLNLKQN